MCIRPYWEVGQPRFQGTLGPRSPSQLPQGASFLSTLSPLKAPDEPPLHRLKSDRADWAGSNPLKPWTRHISWLLQVILTQQRKATKIVAQVPELTHRYSMTLLRTSAAFFFSFRNLQNDSEIWGSCTVSSQSNPEGPQHRRAQISSFQNFLWSHSSQDS